MIEFRVVPVTPFAQNCSILWNPSTRKGAVVDPGGDIDRILEAAKEERVELEKILLTHGHIDHAGGTAELAKRLGIPIEGPEEEERFWIDALAQQSQRFGFPKVEGFEPDRWLKDGDTVQVGGETLEVYHTPGHTPGQVIIFHRKAKLEIVGDVLFAGSIGRTDFPRGDFQTLIRSIRGKLWPLGSDVTFIPGHGPLSTFGEERRSNPFVADGQR